MNKKVLGVMCALLVLSGCSSKPELSAYEFIHDPALGDDDFIEVHIGSHVWCAEIARSEQKKPQGLSGRTSLDEGMAMIFPFDAKTQRNFWMKNMLMDIDIVWILDEEVVDVSRNVQAPDQPVDDSELALYTSKSPSNIVLEVSASEASDIEAGTRVTYYKTCEKTPSS